MTIKRRYKLRVKRSRGLRPWSVEVLGKDDASGELRSVAMSARHWTRRGARRAGHRMAAKGNW